MEYEDMLYRLDKDLENFLIFLYAQFKSEEELVVTLTSAHGTSPSFNPVGGTERERFNNRQMEVIVNAFLGARYGSDDYILGFSNNALYLNHELILRKPKENIVLCRLGINKAKHIENKLNIKIDKTCVLLDDYTKNLTEWESVGGLGIKRLTTVSDNSRRLWKGLELKDLHFLEYL